MNWRGVMPAVTTKFTANNELDLDMFTTNLRAQVDSGVEAIILGGSLGEASTLTESEKQILVEHATSAVGDKVPVVMNIAVATIAVYIGAGGLGTIINEGITGTNSTKLIVGAVAVSLLAIIADYLFLFFQTLLTPKGLREVTS